MILTCPECATSYFVDDARIPAAGRMVKCTSCAARWRAMPEGLAEPEPDPFDLLEAEPAVAAPPEPAPEPVRHVAVDDDLEVVASEPAPRRRAPLPKPEPKRGPMGAIVGWSSLAAVVALLVTGAVVFRTEVVKLLPQSSGAYAGLGLPVNSLGLVIEQVKVEPTFQGGKPVLSVTGAIRNVSSHKAEAPPLRFDLLNRQGHPVATKVARPVNADIPPGGRRHFAIGIADPPSTARDLQVAFDDKAHGAPSAHTAEAAHEPAPVPIEAQPLPADSPDALHDHG